MHAGSPSSRRMFACVRNLVTSVSADVPSATQILVVELSAACQSLYLDRFALVVINAFPVTVIGPAYSDARSRWYVRLPFATTSNLPDCKPAIIVLHGCSTQTILTPIAFARCCS